MSSGVWQTEKNVRKQKIADPGSAPMFFAACMMFGNGLLLCYFNEKLPLEVFLISNADNFEWGRA